MGLDEIHEVWLVWERLPSGEKQVRAVCTSLESAENGVDVLSHGYAAKSTFWHEHIDQLDHLFGRMDYESAMHLRGSVVKEAMDAKSGVDY